MVTFPWNCDQDNVYNDIQRYYYIQVIAFCVEREQLFIKLKIPISRIAARMDIYRLIKFYTPYEYLPSAGIQYAIQVQHLAVTRDNGYFMELSTEDYLHCFGNEFKKKALVIILLGRFLSNQAVLWVHSSII
jgi:hypothetical protein